MTTRRIPDEDPASDEERVEVMTVHPVRRPTVRTAALRSLLGTRRRHVDLLRTSSACCPA